MTDSYIQAITALTDPLLSELRSNATAQKRLILQGVQISRTGRLVLTLSGTPNPPWQHVWTWAYPDDKTRVPYRTPTYNLEISNGVDYSIFEVIRFAPRLKNGHYSVAGLADEQTHSISWFPGYSLGSSGHTEKGAWIVKDNFLIHDGPNTRDPYKQGSLLGSAGCLEVFGENGFTNLNHALLSLSDNSVKSLHEVKADITYKKAQRLRIDHENLELVL